MIPKTKLQKKVAELSSKLPAITEKQKAWAYEKCFDMYAVRSRKTLYCLECGHSWKNKFVLGTTLLGCTCPNCGNNLKISTGYQRMLDYSEYLAILSTRGDMQVVRMIYLHKFMKKHQPAEYSAHEVMQHWVGQDGRITTMSKTVQGLSLYFDQWILHSNLEVRPGSHQGCPRYNIVPNSIYPERKVLPILKRNGFKGQFHDFAPHHLFSLIIDNSYAETLLKAGQIELLKHTHGRGNIKNYWPSVKICIRNNYIVKDASNWFDYLRLLQHFGKDIHSPKYVFPDNLHQEHDRLVHKKQEEDRKIKLEEMRKKLDEEQIKYARGKGKFFGLRLTNGILLIKPLESVEEFMIEGDQLSHCLFTNEYYKRDKSLILSARIDGRPVETIELKLPELTISQSRGLNNKATEYHEQIINLVQDEISQIARRIIEKEAV